jgi:phenylalanyl-tRNA synthetase alpha chain
LKNKICHFYEKENFKIIDDYNPIVEVSRNFDQLLVPKDHPSRKKSESYYLSE